MARVNFTVFVDFDGTISTSDVCEAMVKEFAGDGWQEINARWERKELSTRECAVETFKLFKTKNPDVFMELFKTMELDKYFREFIDFCYSRQYPVYVLSDGYDYYINYLLDREGLEHLPVYANCLTLVPDIQVETPFSSADCDLCGVCKKELMETLKESGSRSIYIGDGYSDFCPAERADLVFAKKNLYRHLREIGKPAHKFESFQDIVLVLMQMLGDKP